MIEPYNKLMMALERVKFGSRGSISINRDAKDISRSTIIEMWNDGTLPQQHGKKWLVGFKSHVTFFMIIVKPLYVGPAKPSKFRERHSQSSADRTI